MIRCQTPMNCQIAQGSKSNANTEISTNELTIYKISPYQTSLPKGALTSFSPFHLCPVSLSMIGRYFNYKATPCKSSTKWNHPKDAGLYEVIENDENCFQPLAKPRTKMTGHWPGRNMRELNGGISTFCTLTWLVATQMCMYSKNSSSCVYTYELCL